MNEVAAYNFIMGTIRYMLLSTLKVMFDVGEEELVDEWKVLEEREDCQKWMKCYREGRLPQAEQELLSSLSTENIRDLERALLFYERINRLDDETLRKAGMEREEIRDSVRAVLEMFECDGLADALLME